MLQSNSLLVRFPFDLFNFQWNERIDKNLSNIFQQTAADITSLRIVGEVLDESGNNLGKVERLKSNCNKDQAGKKGVTVCVRPYEENTYQSTFRVALHEKVDFANAKKTERLHIQFKLIDDKNARRNAFCANVPFELTKCKHFKCNFKGRRISFTRNH